MPFHEPEFRTAREAVRLTFWLPPKKLAKRSPFHKNCLIFYGRFSPRGTKLTPPSSSLGQGSSRAPQRKPSLKSYAIFLRRVPQLQNYLLILKKVGFAEQQLLSHRTG